jgi:membrane associated rhomboid family serine protease
MAAHHDYPPSYNSGYNSYNTNQRPQEEPYESPYSHPQASGTTAYDSRSAYGQHDVNPSGDSFGQHPSRTSYHPSPFKTPFDDDQAYASQNQSSFTLHNQGSHDPFADNSAIPLQTRSHQDPYAPPSPVIKDAEHAYPPYNQPERPLPDQPKGPARFFRGKNKITFVVYTLSLVQIIVFIFELVKNGKSEINGNRPILTVIAQLTGSPIEIHPTFNPVLGPSPYVLINVGARYVPCMREIPVPSLGTNASMASPAVSMPCPNTTTTDPGTCHLQDLCGFGLDLTPHADGSQPQPNQWFRFIVPIFLHGGFIHIGFNLLIQLTLGRDVEMQIGIPRFLLVYFCAGIFGFVFGGNFSPEGLMSTGCSGALFGIYAIVLLDLLYTWKTQRNPVRQLLFILLDMAISFVLGLLPALDNFSHIGGFLTGITLGVCLLRSPDPLRQRIGADEPPYSSMGVTNPNGTTTSAFMKQPVGFFKNRKPLWWAWWFLRVGGLVTVLVAFIVLLRNFYIFRSSCSWCKYLSCLVSSFPLIETFANEL